MTGQFSYDLIGVTKLKQVLLALRVQSAVELNKALGDIGVFHTRRMQIGQFRSYTGQSPSDALQSRSGRLRSSFGFAVSGRGLNASLAMFSAGVPYARIQEKGGTIRPKTKKYLTVPLPPALTGAGVLRGGARLVKRGGQYRTADGDRTFIYRSRRGNLIIASTGARGQRSRSGSASKPFQNLYVLKKEVKIKPRLNFVKTFEKRTRRYVDLRLQTAGVRILSRST